MQTAISCAALSGGARAHINEHTHTPPEKGTLPHSLRKALSVPTLASRKASRRLGKSTIPHTHQEYHTHTRGFVYTTQIQAVGSKTLLTKLETILGLHRLDRHHPHYAHSRGKLVIRNPLICTMCVCAMNALYSYARASHKLSIQHSLLQSARKQHHVHAVSRPPSSQGTTHT